MRHISSSGWVDLPLTSAEGFQLHPGVSTAQNMEQDTRV